MTLYAGIDLHSNNNVVVVQDEEDNVVGRRRLANDLRTVSAWLEPYRNDLAGVVVESTYNWYWLVDGLIEQGYTVHLANTAAIQQYDGLKYRGAATQAVLMSVYRALRLRGHNPTKTIADALKTYLEPGQLPPLPD